MSADATQPVRHVDRAAAIDGHRIVSVVATRRHVAAALGVAHPYRQAVLELCEDLAARALVAAVSSSGHRAPFGQPARLALTVGPTAVRVEARGADIAEAVPDPAVGDRLATRWGITHHQPTGSTLWFAFGAPISGEQVLRR